jgi:uncharacterized protein (DUF342 family)
MNESKESPKVESEDYSTPAIDAVVSASISSDRIEAYLTITPPVNGGAAPTLERMFEALTRQKITYNIDIEKLKELAESPIYNENILIARGVPPINGIDGKVEFKIRTAKSELKPKENDDGTVNYRELDLVENVTKGQVLCIITPPTEGSPGISVQGIKIAQKRGRPARSYLGNNTAFNEDGTEIISKIDGQVEFNGLKINVNETFTIRGNIDNSTGNITVAGNLYVSGMICPGYAAEAKGNLDINGTIESASIRVEGNINLRMGAINSRIIGLRNLKCKFLESCTITVKDNIEASSTIKCNIICGKSLKVSGSNAKIVGGSYIVGNNIEALSIGSEYGIETVLELGTDYTMIERQRELLALIPELQKQINKLKPLITLLREFEGSSRIPPEKKEILEKANISYLTVMGDISKAKHELDEINLSIIKKGFGYIICTDSIYPGVKVIMGKETFIVNEILRNVRIYSDNGTIAIGRAH